MLFFLPLENIICLSKDVSMLTKKATSTGHKPYKISAPASLVCFILRGIGVAFVAQDSISFFFISLDFYELKFFSPFGASSFWTKIQFSCKLV
jgi:hypothetical protein